MNFQTSNIYERASALCRVERVTLIEATLIWSIAAVSGWALAGLF